MIIDPHRFYEPGELEKIVHGRIKLETLRKYGLVGLARGYWGQNIIDALNRFCQSKSSQRGVIRKEDAYEFFEKQKDVPRSLGPDKSLSARKIHPPPGVASTRRRSRAVESQRSQLERLLPEDTV
jgi:hypothetical protein